MAFENGQISDFWGLVTLTLDRVMLHTVMRRASLVDLYLHTKFHWNRRNFLWTDGHLRLALLGWLGGVDLKITWIEVEVSLS